jgi:hypothetical protein
MQMYSQKLIAGVHFGPDYEADPVVEKVKDPVTGAETETYKYPTKRYNRGDVILDPEDLVAKEPGRYAPVTGPRRRETVEVKGRVVSAPSGPPPQGDPPNPDDLTPARKPDLELHPQRPPGAPPTPRPGTERDKMAKGEVKDAAADKAGRKKSGRAEDKAAETAYRDELEQMTVADLREHAREGGVQLHGASTKADIIDAIVKGDKDESGE